MPLKKRDRGVEAAQAIIRNAFEDLQRTVSPADADDFAGTTLESVQKAALDIENQLGMRSSLRNMRRLMPLFLGLHHYSGAIEVLCNGTPYLPWIWAPIKLILKVSRIAVLETLFPIFQFFHQPYNGSLTRCRTLDCIGLRRGNRTANQSLLTHWRVFKKVSSSRRNFQEEHEFPTDSGGFLRRYSSLP